MEDGRDYYVAAQRPLRVLFLTFVEAVWAAALAASWFFVAFPLRGFGAEAFRARAAGGGGRGGIFTSEFAATFRECERRTRVGSGATGLVSVISLSG